MTTFESVFLWCECIVCLAGIILAIRVRRDIVLKAADIASLIFWMLVMCFGVGLLFEFRESSRNDRACALLGAADWRGLALEASPRRALQNFGLKCKGHSVWPRHLLGSSFRCVAPGASFSIRKRLYRLLQNSEAQGLQAGV